MFKSRISALLLLVVFCNNYYYARGLEVIPRTRLIGKKIFFSRKYSFHEGNLVYVLCDSNLQPTINCKVLQEKYPYEKATHSCPVTLENTGNNGLLTIVVAALGQEKAVLIWKYQDKHRSTVVIVGTINLQTCQLNRAKIPNSSVMAFLELYYVTKFVSYEDDSFDIFYNDPKSLRGNAPLYKMQFDETGKIKNEPRIVDLERGRYIFVASVANNSPSKGLIYEFKNLNDMSSNQRYHLWLVRPNGRRKFLTEYNAFPNSDVSAGNNFISVCYTQYKQQELTSIEPEINDDVKPEFHIDVESHLNHEIEFELNTTIEPEITTTIKPETYTEITCTQYNEDGKIIFTTTLPVTTHEIVTLKSHNLPNGGMLVMYGAKERKQIRNKDIMFEVVKLDPDGIKAGRQATQRLEIPNGMIRNTYIYKYERGHCATVIFANASSDLSLREEYPVHLTILAHCFNDYETFWEID